MYVGWCNGVSRSILMISRSTTRISWKADLSNQNRSQPEQTCHITLPGCVLRKYLNGRSGKRMLRLILPIPLCEYSWYRFPRQMLILASVQLEWYVSERYGGMNMRSSVLTCCFSSRHGIKAIHSKSAKLLRNRCRQFGTTANGSAGTDLLLGKDHGES
jgi:hypothetical protein